MAGVSTVPVPEMARPRLPLSLQIIYGVGEIPITVTMGLIGIYVLFFYNSVMRLDGALAGFGVTAGLIVDAVVDPYIGFLSDRSQLALGRRQSFMLAGCLGMGPFFWALLSPPQSLAKWPLFAWLLLTSLGFRLCFAAYRIPYLSLGAELTQDYDGRTKVIAIRSLLGVAGMAAAATIPLLVLFHRIAGGADPKLQYAGYPRLGMFFGAVMTGAGLVAVFGTQSRRSFGDLSGAAPAASSFFPGMWMFLRNRDFRVLWISFTLSSVAVVVNFNLSFHFLKWYAGVESHQWLSIIQGSFYTGIVLGVAGWIWISKRGEKRNLHATSVMGLIGIMVLATVAVGRGHLIGPGNFVPLAAGEFLAGVFASALWVLPFSMMADVVDEDELASGTRREGTCFGIMNFGEKLASGGALLLSGALLSHFIHLVPGQDAQSASATERIGIAYGVAPGILLALAVVMVLRFGLNRRRVAEIQARLATRSR